METNKSVKRALSLVLAMAMLVGSLFTANIGINTKVEAAEGTVLYWDGSTYTEPTTQDAEGNYIIDTAAKLAYLACRIHWGSGYATYGKTFKVADGIKSIVLQPESLAAIKDKTSAAEVKKFFEDNVDAAKNWNPTGYAPKYPFQGTFDGNGATVYGLYSKGSSTYHGLFGTVDQGAVIKNVTLKNSYLYEGTNGYIGALFANSATNSDAWNQTGNKGDGAVTVEKCASINNYMYAPSTDYGNRYKFGALTGGLMSDYLIMNNCIAYGNDATTGITTPDGAICDMPLLAGLGGTAGTNSVTNVIALGATPYNRYDFGWGTYVNHKGNGTNTSCFENVYTDQPIGNFIMYNGSTAYNNFENSNMYGLIKVDAESIKGAKGKVIMKALNWATDETDGVWYAIDGDYPTLFKPDGWKDVENIVVWKGSTATGFAGGTGTEADPYLIETPDQLYKMVVDGGKTNGKYTYYKVKDGVKNLYLSSALEGGYETVKSVAAGTEGTDYYNWTTASRVVFEGNFDGNGVNIRGMISKSTSNNANVGLVQILGNKAIVKNINFDTCYVNNTHKTNAALLASGIINYKDENGDGTDDDGGAKNGYNLVYNASVRNSSINSKSTAMCAGLVCSYNAHPDMLQMVNCFYDGYTCEMSSSDDSAGIASYNWGTNNFQASGCISLGAPVVTNKSGTTTFNDYTTGTKSGHPVYLYNCYTDVDEAGDTTVVELVNAEGSSVITDDYDYVTNMPLIDWANGWQVIDDNGRNVPMPQVRTAADVPATWDTGEVVLDYNRLIGTADGGAGRTPYKGTYGHFEMFTGSGTESAPYLISTPLELARAIGAGGKNISDKLYFKLTCDIDVSGMPWLNSVGARPTNGGTGDTYVYVPFEGTLDGDGHSVIGLYAVNGNSDEEEYDAAEDWKSGLIPELNGGTVKNLHIRNSYAATGVGDNTTGILVGKIVSGTVEGCSVENSYVAGDKLAGENNGTVKNSYIGDKYYNAEGTQVTADQIDVANNSNVWYIGAKEGAAPKLLNRAQTMTCVDADGDGIGDEYGAGDLTAIRSKLLRKAAYKNIYADANHDGRVNTTDLVIMRRYVIDDYNKTADGFWRNIELGNIGIYYAENDTQDMARTLELYFESIYGSDIRKYAGSAVTDSSVENTYTTLPTENAVILIKDTPTDNGYDDYSVTFDSEKNLLTVKGGSFTAVEQAVIDFINESNPVTGVTAQFNERSILDLTTTDQIITLAEDSNEKMVATTTTSDEYSYKAKKTIDGVDYYYAWGDEFEGSNTSFSTDNWYIGSYRSEGTATTGTTAKNKENPNLDSIKDLWEVNDGRLTIWRGVNTDVVAADASTYSWGYKGVSLGNGVTNDWNQTVDSEDAYVDAGLITTQNSMLFKHGYIEMEASLPSDGHAFPAWWFLTSTTPSRNSNIASSLYGKIYSINKLWNGTDIFNVSNANTYKYQLPSAHLEFDIVEPMQTQSNASTSAYKNTTATYQKYADTYNHYKRDFNLTVHKIYDENADSDNLYIYNWNSDGNGATLASTIARKNFTSSAGGDSWIHRYDFSKYGGYTVGGSWVGSDYYGAYNMNRDMTATVKYGFAWNANETDGTYSLTVYINGVKAAAGNYCDKDMVVNQSTGHEAAYSDYIFNKGTTEDAKLWNQYAYMLLDNSYYTNNSSDSYDMFTDLLAKGESGSTTSAPLYGKKDNYKIDDKATFEINYVRVYQQDGRRDIVTRDTENFNNGNHFGYGVN